MTFEERVLALSPLGFSDRQTRFLVTVALHGGFCLRRHYAAFANVRYGMAVRDFLDRLVRQRLASSFMFRRDRGHVYHLNARRIYAAIGQEDNRNRRVTSQALIARKLMVLDYVLCEPAADWYATEQDKIDLFTGPMNVPTRDLPQKVFKGETDDVGPTIRYFVHKQPISVTGGESPVVTFVCLAIGLTGQDLLRFLADHSRLLGRLPNWRIVAACPRHLQSQRACDEAFRRFEVIVAKPRSPSEVAALRRFFQTRDAVIRGDVNRLPFEDIQNYQRARERFTAPAFEVLYRQWCHDGEAIFADDWGREIVEAINSGRGQLVRHALPFSYDRFGSLPGVA